MFKLYIARSTVILVNYQDIHSTWLNGCIVLDNDNFTAGPPFEFLCKYESLIPYLRATYYVRFNLYAVPSAKISHRLSHVSQILLIKHTVVVQMEILIWELLVVYSAMNVGLKSSALQKFSTINSTIYTSIYLLTIIVFCSMFAYDNQNKIINRIHFAGAN